MTTPVLVLLGMAHTAMFALFFRFVGDPGEFAAANALFLIPFFLAWWWRAEHIERAEVLLVAGRLLAALVPLGLQYDVVLVILSPVGCVLFFGAWHLERLRLGPTPEAFGRALVLLPGGEVIVGLCLVLQVIGALALRLTDNDPDL